MDDYIGQDLKKVIKSATLCKGKSKETGSEYLYINFLFNNGYEKRMFLNTDSSYIIKYCLDESQVDNLIFN